MRIPRFYCPDISSDVLEIHDQKIIHHLIKVLRARQGQCVVLFDGNGKSYREDLSKGSSYILPTISREAFICACTD